MTAEPWVWEPAPEESYSPVPGFCTIHGRDEPCVSCGVVKLRAGLCPGCGFDLDPDAHCIFCGKSWPKL